MIIIKLKVSLYRSLSSLIGHFLDYIAKRQRRASVIPFKSEGYSEREEPSEEHAD